MSSNWKVGEKVTVVQHGIGGIRAITTIVTVGKLKLKLADGSEWNVNGTAWGSSKDGWSYNRSTLIRFVPKHEAELRRQVAFERVRSFWNHDHDRSLALLTTEELESIASIFDGARERASS